MQAFPDRVRVPAPPGRSNAHESPWGFGEEIVDRLPFDGQMGV
jgi:hypothetical protein